MINNDNLNDAFMRFFKEKMNCRFVTDFESVVNAYIKKDNMYEVFKDCKETQWDKTLDIFIKCGKGYWIFNQTEIDFHIQGEGWYFLDITTTDFLIRIENEKEFYYYHKQSSDEFTKKINNKNVKEMFRYLSNLLR